MMKQPLLLFDTNRNLWWILCFLGGAMLLLAHNVFSLWGFAFVALVPLMSTALKKSPIQAFVAGVITILPTFLYICYWFSAMESRHGKEMIILGLGVSMLSLWGTLGILIHFLNRNQGNTVFWLAPLAVWGLEAMREKAFLLAPFLGPFFSLGLTQVSPGNPIFQSADLVGVCGLSAVVVLGSLVITAILLDRRPWHPQLIGFCVLGTLVVYGFIRTTDSSLNDQIRIATVQANISDTDGRLETYRRFTPIKDEFTSMTKAAKSQGAQFIVWPEQSIPFAVRTFNPLTNWLADLASELDVFLVVGGNDHAQNQAGKWENNNTVFLFAKADGLVLSHDKAYLAPLGSPKLWAPLSDFRRKWGWFGLGAGEGMYMSYSDVPWAHPICFEAIFSHPIREAVQLGAEFVVISGNDSPFQSGKGKFFSLRHMMGRSVEFRRWVCRASNCGYVGFISSKGKLVGMIPAGKATFSVETIERATGQTVFSRLGFIMEFFAIGFCGLAIVLVSRRNFLKQIAEKGIK